MSIHIDKLATEHDAPTEPYNIEIQHTPTGATLLGIDLDGNQLATRTLTRHQLADAQLTDLVMADLKTTLLALVRDRDLFPHPAALEPERR